MKDKLEAVFLVLGEGGGLKISRIEKNGNVKFLYNHREFDPSDEGLDVNIDEAYSTFQEPFEFINIFPWHMLHVETVHKDYIESVCNI